VFLLLEFDIFNDLRTVSSRADESWSVVTARQSIQALFLGVTFQGHFTLLISVFVSIIPCAGDTSLVYVEARTCI